MTKHGKRWLLGCWVSLARAIRREVSRIRLRSVKQQIPAYGLDGPWSPSVDYQGVRGLAQLALFAYKSMTMWFSPEVLVR
mgnify:CR=1 FL=1